jgi:hypothetical protein
MAPDSEEMRILREAEDWLRAQGHRIPTPEQFEIWARESGDTPSTPGAVAAWLDEHGYS